MDLGSAEAPTSTAACQQFDALCSIPLQVIGLSTSFKIADLLIELHSGASCQVTIGRMLLRTVIAQAHAACRQLRHTSHFLGTCWDPAMSKTADLLTWLVMRIWPNAWAPESAHIARKLKQQLAKPVSAPHASNLSVGACHHLAVLLK